MATAKPKAAPRKLAAADSAEAVDAFMAALDHPHKDAVEALRKVITGADKSVAEGIKWNAPSWRTTEYFATTHLRAKTGIGLILHLGAKARDDPGMVIEDPKSILTWLGKDRAMVSYADATAVKSGATALKAVLKQWLHFV
jgi:hypothetical protein